MPCSNYDKKILTCIIAKLYFQEKTYTILNERECLIIKKSFVLTAALPSAAADPAVFENAACMLKRKGIDTIEFFCDFPLAEEYGRVLQKNSVDGVYLAATHQKRNGLSLCATDPVLRQNAVSETKKCLDAAKKAGAKAVLLTGGFYFGPDAEPASWDNLKQSIEELHEYMPDILLTLEPGDRSVDSKQLAGPTDDTVAWLESFPGSRSFLQLTMDTSHIAQLGEDVSSAIDKTKKYCEHIHIANCILKENHPLYGDKHPLFSDKDAYYSIEELKDIASCLASSEKDLTVSIEIINRSEDEWEMFERILEEESWFFSVDQKYAGPAISILNC